MVVLQQPGFRLTMYHFWGGGWYYSIMEKTTRQSMWKVLNFLLELKCFPHKDVFRLTSQYTVSESVIEDLILDNNSMTVAVAAGSRVTMLHLAWIIKVSIGSFVALYLIGFSIVQPHLNTFSLNPRWHTLRSKPMRAGFISMTAVTQ